MPFDYLNIWNYQNFFVYLFLSYNRKNIFEFLNLKYKIVIIINNNIYVEMERTQNLLRRTIFLYVYI